MKSYWSDTKLNGSPLAPGQLCFIQDYTDEGLQKIATYGATKDEIVDKLARTNASAQQMIVAQRTNPPAAPPAAPPATPSKARLTPDERMNATVDLSNPANAGKAIVQLFEDQTGISVNQMILTKFRDVCLAWEKSRPEFYRTPANQKLVADGAIQRAGGIRFVTVAHLEASYQELHREGYLAVKTESQEPEPQPAPSTLNPAEQTGETPSPTPARPSVSATSHRSNRLGGVPTSQGWKPKYTREQILAMPQGDARRLIESNDAEYQKACEYWWPSQARATA